MWIPLPLIGIPPWMVFVGFSINLVYQFFVHTERVDRLPRPIELVFNTPSHHRVHHGCDPEYLDKNYAGILIIWDRVFGTFPRETHRPTYGLTTPVRTHNILTLQDHEYAAIVARRGAAAVAPSSATCSARRDGEPGVGAANAPAMSNLITAMGLPAVGQAIVGVSSARTVGSKGVPRVAARSSRSSTPPRPSSVVSAMPGRAVVDSDAVRHFQAVGSELLRVQGKPLHRFVDRAGANLVDHIEAVLDKPQPPRQMAEDTLTAIFEALAPRPHDWNVVNDRTTPAGGRADEAARRVRTAIADQAARGVAAFADLPNLTDSGDLSLVTDVWISAVTACVSWWLRHPDESAERMSRRSRRVLTAFAAAISDADNDGSGQ